MYIESKPDWEETKERYIKWWNGEYFGRCAMSIKAPLEFKNKPSAPSLPHRLEDRWTDFDYIARRNEYIAKTTYYCAEAFPVWNPGYPGCDSHCAYVGANVTLSEETGWIDPIIEKGELTDHDFNDIQIKKDGFWWNFGINLRNFCVQHSKGLLIPSNFAFGACGDTLAALRSSEKLLFDIMDCPEYVRDFDLYLMKQWIEIFQNSYDITHKAAQGSTCFFELWSPGKFYAIQNDFAYMLSPRMFEEIFLPSIKIQSEYLDHAVYHVDGIGNFSHIDVLMQIPAIQAIQILPGEGKPSPLYYMDILKKVQSAGRNLHISIPPNEVKYALSELSAKGLFIATSCKSKTEADDLLQYVEKWSTIR